MKLHNVCEGGSGRSETAEVAEQRGLSFTADNSALLRCLQALPLTPQNAVATTCTTSM
jgi:hypothetical protein